jgi:hypothetical protein
MPRVAISEAESSTEYFYYKIAEYRVLGRVLHVSKIPYFGEIWTKMLRYSHIYIVLSSEIHISGIYLTKSA